MTVSGNASALHNQAHLLAMPLPAAGTVHLHAQYDAGEVHAKGMAGTRLGCWQLHAGC